MHKTGTSSIVSGQGKANAKKDDLELAVLRVQAERLVSIGLFNLISGLVITGVIGFVMLSSVQIEDMAIWYYTMMLVIVGRFVASVLDQNSRFWRRDPKRSLRHHNIGGLCLGLGIGSVSYWLESPEAHLEHALVVAICLVIGAYIVTNSIASYANIVGIAMSMFIPMGVKMLYLGTHLSHVVAVLILVNCLYLVFLARKVTRIFLDGVRSRLETEQLAKEVAMANRDLSYQATHDSLTGLSNRASFHNKLATDAYSLEGTGHELVLILVDLDGFKAVNDTMGHGAGDEVIRQVAQRLRYVFEGKGAQIARLGGDEFAMICPFETPLQLDRLCSEILARLSRPYFIHNTTATIGASLGAMRFKRGCQNPDALLGQTDAALYKAKNTGRGRWVLAEPLGPMATVRQQKPSQPNPVESFKQRFSEPPVLRNEPVDSFDLAWKK